MEGGESVLHTFFLFFLFCFLVGMVGEVSENTVKRMRGGQ